MVPRERPRPFKCTRGVASPVQRRGASTHTGTFGRGQSRTLTRSQFLGNGERYREVEATHTFVLYVLVAIFHFSLEGTRNESVFFLNFGQLKKVCATNPGLDQSGPSVLKGRNIGANATRQPRNVPLYVISLSKAEL